MHDSNIRDKPKARTGDLVHTLTKTGLSAIPVVGGPAAELFSAIIVPPLARRRDGWIESIAEGLKSLEERVDGFKIEALSQNETFITTVMHASQAAIRNHQKEKLEALRNAVLNSALSNDPEEDLQLMFLSFVDALTPSHLRVLEFYAESGPGIHPTYGSMEPLDFIKHFFPEMKECSEFCSQVFRDLTNYGLIEVRSSAARMAGIIGIISNGGITDMGKLFINFITSPIENDDEGE